MRTAENQKMKLTLPTVRGQKRSIRGNPIEISWRGHNLSQVFMLQASGYVHCAMQRSPEQCQSRLPTLGGHGTKEKGQCES